MARVKTNKEQGKNSSLLIPNSPTCLPKVRPAYRRYGLPAAGRGFIPLPRAQIVRRHDYSSF